MKESSLRPTHSAIVFLRRLLVAATLVVSLLSALIPLATASSVHLCTMECCAGKAPHLAGACSAGLMKSTPAVTQEPELWCGLQQDGRGLQLTATHPLPLELIKAGAEPGDSEWCGVPLGDLSEHEGSAGLRNSNPPDESSSIAAASMTGPCSADCGTCSSGYLRQPRPREQATGAQRARPRAPARLHLFCSLLSRTTALPGDYQKPPSRGPPIPLS